VTALMRGADQRLLRNQVIRVLSLLATSASSALAIALWFLYDGQQGGVQLAHHFVWIRPFNIEYFLGVDGISVAMVILSGIVFFIANIASWTIGQEDRLPDRANPRYHAPEVKPAPGYHVMLLLLQTGVYGSFLALDFFLFYIFWELMLLPMYFLIGIWGGPNKEYAAIKFFLYTLAGSVFMLIAMIALYYTSVPLPGIELTLVDGTAVPHTFNILLLKELGQSGHWLGAGTLLGLPFAKVVWLFLFVAFAIKVPMVPFHTWLPDAHVEAPTAISVILAGILLKLGTYGMLRFNFEILPRTTDWAALGIGICGAVGIVYTALVCMAQKDLKKLIAYSSVSHMGFVLLGMAAFTQQGMVGAVYQMWAHGIISPLLFLIAGVVYDRAHTREIDGFGGLARKMPEYSGLVGLAFFASLGLPGLAGFVGEALVFIGGFGKQGDLALWFQVITAISVTAVVFTASYYLWAMQRMFLGPLNAKWQWLPDLNWRERLCLYPLAGLTVLFGVAPGLLFDLINPTLFAMVDRLNQIALQVAQR
ncbi:MAG: NADH-quinone oxidoreductase subunit M, partial [Deltaproteobacteria bacterium]|nr:NADH-quinone oxidoreductase subunit M [Deltaproteobacteria bacterium]